jgi:hypothetical protein
VSATRGAIPLLLARGLADGEDGEQGGPDVEHVDNEPGLDVSLHNEATGVYA